MTGRSASSACSSCPRAGLTRRAVLAGAGAVGAAGLLAACGGGESTPQATGGVGDEVITELGPLQSQGAMLFDTPDGKAIAIARDDDVVAYSAVCTHDGCTVGWDADAKQISCPCHGSRFDPSDGSVVAGPARSPLASVPVVADEAEGVLRRG